METVTKSIKTQEDEYTFPNEESVKRFEEEIKKESISKKDEYTYSMEELEEFCEKGFQEFLRGETHPWDEKFDRYMEWVVDNMEEGVPFDPPIEEVPEEFRCYIK